MPMKDLWYRFVDLVCDPLDIKNVVYEMNSRTAKFQGELHHSIKQIEELAKSFYSLEESLEKSRFLEQVNSALYHSVPVMFWVKDTDGRYLIANKAARDNLLFSENPVGQDDRELAQAIHDRIGADKHTFGAICRNSDLEVLKQELPMKFNEDALVNDQYITLQVHKNVVRDSKGNVVGVVGIGRDITFEVEMLTKAIDITACEDTKAILHNIIDHYRFEDRT